MNNTTLISHVSSEIPSLIIPIDQRQLLLPTVSVAEMLPYTEPQLDSGNLPNWFLGKVAWRGIHVPMISYEAINGDSIPVVKVTSQMAILNTTGVSDALPFLCFPTQGIPRLSRVEPKTIKEDTKLANKSFDNIQVTHNELTLTLPNVSQLEQALVDLLNL